MYEKIKEHIGHKIEIASYGKKEISIECVDCNEVLTSYEKDKNEDS